MISLEAAGLEGTQADYQREPEEMVDLYSQEFVIQAQLSARLGRN
jgi:hypothetical protein